jgi:outer membrane protein OmpA-like peptidoglycan-associated protein
MIAPPVMETPAMKNSVVKTEASTSHDFPLSTSGLLARRPSVGRPALHQPIGNQATLRRMAQLPQTLAANSTMHMQPKLAIGAVDDPMEHEADRVADHVMRMPAPRLQRACVGCGATTEHDDEPKIHRLAEGGTQQTEAPDGIATRLGAGRPMEQGVRDFFEPRFGTDFSTVRVHADASADAAARSVNALAFTLGRDVVFRADQYAPHADSGRRLLAHELTHVVQQRGSDARVQRQAAATCPPREKDEKTRSKAAGGVLKTDVVFTAASHQLTISDFAVDSAVVPAGVTDSPGWQEAMSMITGDRTMRLALDGFTDCAGTDAENLDLRDKRVQAVIAAMPAKSRSRVLFSFTNSTTSFVDTNATAEGRARNRAVRVTLAQEPPKGQDPCDLRAVAHNLDEYLFLVRCMEQRLGLTAAKDAPVALSVLRQIYYGSESWSASQNAAWNLVIQDHPWSPGSDPTKALHQPLMSALQASQVVEGTDIGHILTGMDAMMHPQNAMLHKGTPGVQSTLPNEEWATWAGDVGSAAGEWVMDGYMTTPKPKDLPAFFQRFAGDADLNGDIDAFAMRAGGGGAATPPAQLMQTISLTGTLSEALLQYFRITGSARDVAHGNRVRNFVEAYGGVISGKGLSNRAAFVARLRPAVAEFTQLYTLNKLLHSAADPQGPTTTTTMPTLLTTAIDAMTGLFVDWLVARL